MKQSFPDRVASHVREQGLLKAGDRVGVAVSGGPDSVALLRVLLELRGELGAVVSVVLHFNHKLRGKDSEADERFVQSLAEKHGLEFRRAEADTAAAAKTSGSGIEAAARELRYEFFEDMLRLLSIDCIATGHTLDDQAETVLMRLMRGSGARGLAGIFPKHLVSIHEGASQAFIVRPFLTIRRNNVLEYLRSISQEFREDASNRDPQFLRNRVRHELLPLLERDYNPQIAEALAQTAEIARDEWQVWERQVHEVMRPPLFQWKAALPAGERWFTPVTDPAALRAAEAAARDREPYGAGSGCVLAVDQLLRLSLPLQRLVLQNACGDVHGALSFQQVEALRELVSKPRGTIDLGGGFRVIREGDQLRFWFAEAAWPVPKEGYAMALTVPGQVGVPTARLWLKVAPTLVPEPPSDRPLGAADSISANAIAGNTLVVRNWRAGDRFYPQHSSGPKKVKELLTAKKITGRERALWPVVAAGERVVWLRGWGVAADAVAPAGSAGVRIEEVVSAE